MSKSEYWQKQNPKEALFSDVLWNRPERRDQAGRLAIIGGNSGGFWSIANSYRLASKLGVGEIRVVLPDSLRSKIPANARAQIGDLIFAPSNYSGGLSGEAAKTIEAAASWAGNLLFIGDNGANSETAQLFGQIMNNLGENNKITLARDTVDLIIYDAESILNLPSINLVVSVAQLQKIFRSVYYPRMITFSQGVRQMVETLHKFTITYSAMVTVYHEGTIILAKNGQIISQDFDEPMRIWSGEVPTAMAAWSVWQSDMWKASATALIG